MKNSSKRKPWSQMTAEELAVATKEFDKPIAWSRMRPMSPRARAKWERARRSKPDVSIFVRDGRADVVVVLDDELLNRARAYARRKKTTLPKMIDQGLRGLLAFAG